MAGPPEPVIHVTARSSPSSDPGPLCWFYVFNSSISAVDIHVLSGSHESRLSPQILINLTISAVPISMLVNLEQEISPLRELPPNI